MFSFEHALNNLQLNQTWCPYFEKFLRNFRHFRLRELLEKFLNPSRQTTAYIYYLL